MKKIHIFNPASGKIKCVPKNIKDEVYQTTCIGDAKEYAQNLCNQEDVYFVVHGGDGTISEVANGIIKANAGERAILSVVPKGTGNDFVKSFKKDDDIKYVDAIKFNDEYCINSLNAGLDLLVVQESNKFKKIPLVSGSFAYILGVVSALFKRKNEKWDITIENHLGQKETFENQEYSLVLFANGSYYGGGFYAAPLANPCDGLIDMILVKKVSTLTLLKLILGYRSGKHFGKDDLSTKYKKYMIYRKCTNIKINNIKQLCSDGEIFDVENADISIVKNAIRYV